MEHRLRALPFQLQCVVAGIFFATNAFAFTQTITSAGAPVRWSSGTKFNLVGNAVNNSGISESDLFDAVVRALHRWQRASDGQVSFDYWQGTDDSIYEPNSNYNGQSSIYFSSHSTSGPGMSSSVLGLTQVWYNTTSGQILEADTILNDKDFRFTLNPQDTSGFGSSNSTYGGSNRVFIENVITHELGHSLGFSHAGGLQSTMLFMESPEQAHLGCDEQVGIHAIYPSSDAGSRGTIAGTIVAKNGHGVFGAHVLAISRLRGTVLSSAMTDSSGHYAIPALEPGSYYLLAEPYYAGPAPLPAFYSGMNPLVCSGAQPFGRTILTDQSGYRAQPVSVNRGATVNAPTLEVGCNAGAAAVHSLSPNRTVYDVTTDGGGFGVVDRLGGHASNTYKLQGLSGHISLRGMSYSLYSPIQVEMQLTDSSGNGVNLVSDPQSYVGDSGYVNYDSVLEADELPMGDYTLTVSARSLSATLYPAGSVSMDTEPFVLVTGSINEGSAPLASTLATNARCRMDETFAAYQSPPGNPPRSSTDQSSDGAGFCGTIRNKAQNGPKDGPKNDYDKLGPGGPRGPGSGPSAPVIVGWFLPWLAMGAIARLVKALAGARSRR
jgi:hypothetical protein